MRARQPAALAIVGALAGCATLGDPMPPGWTTGDAWDTDAVAAMPAVEDPYLAALQEGYLRLARAELAEFDWIDGAAFTARARAAASGRPAAPFDLEQRALDGPAVDELAATRAEIVSYISSPGAMLRAPRQIGEAQVSWDCWVQEAEEGHQADQIAVCRDQLKAMLALVRDLAALPGNMAVVLPQEGEIGGIEVRQQDRTVTLDRAFAAAGTGETLGDLPVAESEIRDAFAGAIAARPKPPQSYRLLFEFGRARIGDDAFDQIMQAAEDVRSRDAAEVIVTGHADAPGGTAANLALSRQRAEAVRRALLNELRREESPVLSVVARGEHDPAVRTRRAEQDNRRVIVLVR